GLVQTFAWSGPVLASRSWDADGLTRSEVYGYDDDKQLTTITRPRSQTTIAYDTIGAMVSQTDVALDASVPPATRCQQAAPGGRVLEAVSAEGIRPRYTYDGEGRVRSVVAGELALLPGSVSPSTAPWDDTCLPHPTGTAAVGTVATY